MCEERLWRKPFCVMFNCPTRKESYVSFNIYSITQIQLYSPLMVKRGSKALREQQPPVIRRLMGQIKCAVHGNAAQVHRVQISTGAASELRL